MAGGIKSQMNDKLLDEGTVEQDGMRYVLKVSCEHIQCNVIQTVWLLNTPL